MRISIKNKFKKEIKMSVRLTKNFTQFIKKPLNLDIQSFDYIKKMTKELKKH